MKKVLLLTLLVCFLVVPVQAGQNLFQLSAVKYPIIVNGVELKSDLPILNYNGSTYVPLKKVSEATGAIVEWDGVNKKVLIRNVKEPSPSPTPNLAGTRSNPLGLNQKGITQIDEYSDGIFTAEVSIKELIRGEAAWTQIQAANQFNQPAPAGYEYILAKVSLFISDATDKNAQYSVSSLDFVLVSTSGVDYESDSIYPPEPKLYAKLYSGGSTEGWLSFKVKTDDIMPLIVFNKDYSGKGGLWFKVYN